MSKQWKSYSVLCALFLVLCSPQNLLASEYQYSLKALSDVVKEVKWQLQDLALINPSDPRYQQERIRIANFVRKTVRNQIVTCNQLREWGRLNPANHYRCYSSLSNARKTYNFDYDGAARWAWQNGVGRCNEHASLVYYILKKAGAGNDLRILARDADHLFVAWGVVKGANPNEHASWGYNSLVIDSWVDYTDYPWNLSAKYKSTDIFDETKKRDRYARDHWMQFTSRKLMVPPQPIPTPTPAPIQSCRYAPGSVTKYSTNELKQVRNKLRNELYKGSIQNETERSLCHKQLRRVHDELRRRELKAEGW